MTETMVNWQPPTFDVQLGSLIQIVFLHAVTAYFSAKCDSKISLQIILLAEIQVKQTKISFAKENFNGLSLKKAWFWISETAAVVCLLRFLRFRSFHSSPDSLSMHPEALQKTAGGSDANKWLICQHTSVSSPTRLTYINYIAFTRCMRAWPNTGMSLSIKRLNLQRMALQSSQKWTNVCPTGVSCTSFLGSLKLEIKVFIVFSCLFIAFI